LIFDTVPSDPNREEYRQGNTMGTEFRHWRRAKIGRRFRLFVRFDSKTRIILFAWVNDENTLRSSGSKSDPYVVFQRMLERGHPPDDWAALVTASGADWR
jgi:toxin YhaV